VGKVGINLGGYGIFLGDKGSLSVYIRASEKVKRLKVVYTATYRKTRTAAVYNVNCVLTSISSRYLSGNNFK